MILRKFGLEHLVAIFDDDIIERVNRHDRVIEFYMSTPRGEVDGRIQNASKLFERSFVSYCACGTMHPGNIECCGCHGMFLRSKANGPVGYCLATRRVRRSAS